MESGPVPEKAPVVEGDLAALQGEWEGEQVLEGGSHPKEPVVWGRCVVRGDVAWLLPATGYYADRREIRYCRAVLRL